MKLRNIVYTTITIFVMLYSCDKPEPKVQWPEISLENKPFTRWWWLGNILNENDLAVAMKEYAAVGLGGLEITPIYGVKGYEDQFIQYLSDEWVKKLVFTLKEAEKNGLIIDMATGTGWPFGGPWVKQQDACKYMVPKIYELKTGEKLLGKIEFIQKPILRTIGKKMSFDRVVEPIAANDSLQQVAYEQVRYEKPLPLILLMAFSDRGDKLNLTENVIDGELNWTAPEGNWKLYALFQGWHGKIVERAAPGGEGDVIDHFNKSALDHYLEKFNDAFMNIDISSIRAFFNDSYEVDDAVGEADYTPALFDEFLKRRGYDLRNYLPALYGNDTINKIHIKVISDYRQTISELLLENFTVPWSKWAKGKNAIIRNQAHGSPANILDLYAAVDIPETEGKDIIKIKFASSASNVTGKNLTSSESATWLDDHFLGTLAETKVSIDRFFLGGVNHIFYHGTAFSPANEQWPGFLFYASVNYSPSNTFWNDFKAFNHYVARCQSFLQNSMPDNDILVYFPFYDRIADPGRYLLQHFSGGGARGKGSDFRDIVKLLIEEGFSLDYISDKQLSNVSYKKGKLNTGGNQYKVIVVPECEYMPLSVLNKLFDFARKGTKVIFHNNLPKEVPGFGNYDIKMKSFNETVSNLTFIRIDENKTIAEIGKGQIIKTKNINSLLMNLEIYPEEMYSQGLKCIRKRKDDGKVYFIVNNGTNTVDEFVKINAIGSSAAIFNPLTDDYGLAKIRNSTNGTEVYLQLKPQQSCILRTYNSSKEANRYNYSKITKDQVNLDESWEITFIKGGPELPPSQQVSELFSWTEFKSDVYKSFSGSAKYRYRLKIPDAKVDAWMIDLGEVHESARIILNGEELATLYTSPYQYIIPAEKFKDENNLDIIVSNLMANRIINMEQNGEEYKRFYNVNFPARRAENRGDDRLFTAINWEPFNSGLMGPVKLLGVQYIDF